jgi:uncharacterized protein (TIGR02646 family)
MRYIEKSPQNGLILEAQLLLNSARHYNESDRVKDIIRILYSGCCAFCGSSPEASSYYQIEHFYPKGNVKYKKHIKNIFNLHYGCQRCNNLKSTPVHLHIFSPNYYLSGNKWVHSTNNKIESELIYIGHLLYSVNNKTLSVDRAKATIDLFDLNDQKGGGRSGRRYLVEERLKIYDNVYQKLETLYHLLDEEKLSFNIDKAIKQLFMLTIGFCSPQSSFSNMIVQNFGADIIKLLAVYAHKRKALAP